MGSIDGTEMVIGVRVQIGTCTSLPFLYDYLPMKGLLLRVVVALMLMSHVLAVILYVLCIILFKW